MRVISLFLLLITATLSAEVPMLSFQKLEGLPSYMEQATAVHYLQTNLALYEQKEVRMRGFLYKGAEENWILSAEPNLKSCCVASAGKIAQQIFILGLSEGPLNHVVTLRGKFSISPLWDKSGNLVQLYLLTDVQLENVQEWPIPAISLASMGLLGMAMLLYLAHQNRKSEQQ